MLVRYSEYFWLDRAGQGAWTIRHQITNLPAGSVRFDGTQYLLTTGREMTPAGTFDTLDYVMDALYENS